MFIIKFVYCKTSCLDYTCMSKVLCSRIQSLFIHKNRLMYQISVFSCSLILATASKIPYQSGLSVYSRFLTDLPKCLCMWPLFSFGCTWLPHILLRASSACMYLCWFQWPLGWPAGGSGVPAPSSVASA